MSYVDETIERVVAQNPSQPEFHQAVKEVLESLRVVIEANEEAYRRDALLERLTTPERIIMFRVPWVDDKGQVYFGRFYMRKRRGGRVAINPVPPYICNAPKGAGLTEARGRPPLPFYLIKPTKINLSPFGRPKWINPAPNRRRHT